MFKIFALLVLVVYGVSASPTVLSAKPVVTKDEATMHQLPGIANLHEKSLLPIELRDPLPGTENHKERQQVHSFNTHLPGTENLQEKAIPLPQLYNSAYENN